MEQHKLSVNQVELSHWVFLFSGLGLDNKASFYLNEVVPEGLRIDRTETEQAINFVYFRSAANRPGVLAYSYAGAKGMVSKRSALRAQRFSEILVGQRQSAIVAASALCIENSCSEAKRALSKQLLTYQDTQLLFQQPG